MSSVMHEHVVVVGGSAGIGAAVVGRFTDCYKPVIVLDRVAPSRRDIDYIECDLRADESALDDCAERLPEGILAVAYVAGVPGTRPAADVLSINFLAMRHLLGRIAPKVRPGGAMAVVASTAGTGWSSRVDDLEPLLATSSIAEGLDWLADNPSDYPIYSTTKEAAILFSKRWSASLWSQRGVRLNTVSPGPVDTALLGEFEDSMGKGLIDQVRGIAGRHATPADIAPVVEAVLSDNFGWVTGQDIQADAGTVTAIITGAVPAPVA